MSPLFTLETHRQYAEWKSLVLEEVRRQSSRGFLIAIGAQPHPDDDMLKNFQKAYERNEEAILAHRERTKQGIPERPDKKGGIKIESEDESEDAEAAEKDGGAENIDPHLFNGPFTSFDKIRAVWSPARSKLHETDVANYKDADDTAKRVIIGALSEPVIRHVNAESHPTSHRLMEFLDAALTVRIDNARLRWLTTRLHTMRMANFDSIHLYIDMFNGIVKELDELDHLPETAIQVNAFLLGLPGSWDSWRQATFIEVDCHFAQEKPDLTLLSSLQTRACTHQIERDIDGLALHMRLDFSTCEQRKDTKCTPA